MLAADLAVATVETTVDMWVSWLENSKAALSVSMMAEWKVELLGSSMANWSAGAMVVRSVTPTASQRAETMDLHWE